MIGEECSSSTATRARDRRVCVEVSASAVRGVKTTIGKNGLECSAAGLGDFSVVRVDLEIAPGIDAGLARNNPTELHHVLIMWTRGRAQRLGLKAAEPEELETYRLLLRRYEPVSTVTTVSKLVDVLATTFGGDLVDSLTDFERPITSLEHEAKETLSDLGCHQGLGERWVSRSSADQHCWHDRIGNICERD